MALRVRIAARAAAEVRRAAEWWLANRPAAAGAVGADFAAAVSLLSEQPGIGAKYLGTRAPGVRRLYLSRVGYFVYYTADGADLKILAFWHASREHPPVL
jgi:plasmid stabilization system protein ParE